METDLQFEKSRQNRERKANQPPRGFKTEK